MDAQAQMDVQARMDKVLLQAYTTSQAVANLLGSGIAHPANPSPEELGNGLRAMLASQDAVREITEHLEGVDARWMIDVLDCAEPILGSEAGFRARIFHILRKLCGRTGRLPTSCYISRSKIEETDGKPKGRGAYGIVFQGSYDGKVVAMKLLMKCDIVNHMWFKEAVVWRFIKHTNIVPFLGVEEDGDSLSLISEWMPGEDTRKYIKTHPDSNRLSLIMDAAQGLLYLHETGIVHGDLKSTNILVDIDGRARLADFGLARVVYNNESFNHESNAIPKQGALVWSAPELLAPGRFGLEDQDPSQESDVYAFAMVIWEIFTGVYPYSGDVMAAYSILNGIRPPRPADATELGLSDSIWHLMERCWDQDRHNRPTMEIVVEELRRAIE